MVQKFPIDKFKKIETPFYYYDCDLLRETLQAINKELEKCENFIVHYAIKANANAKVLKVIQQTGMGADCVSGGEIQRCLDCGFPADKIVYAGVGKSDWEINLGLDHDIFCFNVESVAELEVINELAAKKGKTANVCFRINPDVGAHTHEKITTGLAENKFGIAMQDMLPTILAASKMENIHFIGLHFHIGSQLLEMTDFRHLCSRINEIQDSLEQENIKIKNINVGGGLGIDYDNPDNHPIPDFKSYFYTFARYLKLREGQKLHFELGRAVVGQMGSLITRTLYVKQGTAKQFAIVDAGMTDLIRPALYQASHKIENLSSDGALHAYDVVGPICESSDVFAKGIELNTVHRGDLIAMRSAGAYGEIMASQYNCRKLPVGYTSDELSSITKRINVHF